MRRRHRYPLMLVLALLCQWSGTPERPMLGRIPDITATRVPLDGADPARIKIGAMTFMGGVRLTSRDTAFGGYSSMTIDRGLFTLLSDGGTIARFRLDDRFRLSTPAFGDLPTGPGLGVELDDNLMADKIGHDWKNPEAYDEDDGSVVDW